MEEWWLGGGSSFSFFRSLSSFCLGISGVFDIYLSVVSCSNDIANIREIYIFGYAINAKVVFSLTFYNLRKYF